MHSTRTHRHAPVPRVAPGRPALLALASALLLAGCASSGEKQDPLFKELKVEGGDAVPYDPNAAADDRRTGVLLAEIHRKLDIWTNLTLRGDPKKDARTLTQVESALGYDASKNAALLVDQLDVGAPRNRMISAAALGFVGSDVALGPLLAALDDRDEQVVANALLGLSVLAEPTTPLTRIAGMLEDRGADPDVRNNAGRVLRAMPSLVLNGSEREAILGAARFAIGDEEPWVRIHGLMLLAELTDAESLEDMATLLTDDTPLVRLAASRAVAYLGDVEGEAFGRATRALVGALSDTRSQAFRSAVLGDLRRLTKRNFDDDDAWLKYANRLN
ncbi:MAG: HEAT repeat domain-containing protein [Planctomycetota bacterium]